MKAVWRDYSLWLCWVCKQQVEFLLPDSQEGWGWADLVRPVQGWPLRWLLTFLEVAINLCPWASCDVWEDDKLKVDTGEIELWEIWLGQERIWSVEQLGQYCWNDVAVTFSVEWDNPRVTESDWAIDVTKKFPCGCEPLGWCYWSNVLIWIERGREGDTWVVIEVCQYWNIGDNRLDLGDRGAWSGAEDAAAPFVSMCLQKQSHCCSSMVQISAFLRFYLICPFCREKDL